MFYDFRMSPHSKESIRALLPERVRAQARPISQINDDILAGKCMFFGHLSSDLFDSHISVMYRDGTIYHLAGDEFVTREFQLHLVSLEQYSTRASNPEPTINNVLVSLYSRQK